LLVVSSLVNTFASINEWVAWENKEEESRPVSRSNRREMIRVFFILSFFVSRWTAKVLRLYYEYVSLM
jgi:hypothetical protein